MPVSNWTWFHGPRSNMAYPFRQTSYCLFPGSEFLTWINCLKPLIALMLGNLIVYSYATLPKDQCLPLSFLWNNYLFLSLLSYVDFFKGNNEFCRCSFIVWLLKVTPTHYRKLRKLKGTKKKIKAIFHPTALKQSLLTFWCVYFLFSLAFYVCHNLLCSNKYMRLQKGIKNKTYDFEILYGLSYWSQCFTLQ